MQSSNEKKRKQQKHTKLLDENIIVWSNWGLCRTKSLYCCSTFPWTSVATLQWVLLSPSSASSPHHRDASLQLSVVSVLILLFLDQLAIAEAISWESNWLPIVTLKWTGGNSTARRNKHHSKWIYKKTGTSSKLCTSQTLFYERRESRKASASRSSAC